MNQLEIFQNPEFGTIRIKGTEEQPLFCLADLCKALSLNPSKLSQRLGDDVLSKYPIQDELNRTQLANFVNEDGLYDVILDSRKPKAKAFRKWVTGEILPAIRTKGGYIVAQQNDTPEMIMARALKLADETIKRNEERLRLLEQTTQSQAEEIEAKDAQISELNNAVTEMKPKCTYVDAILQSKDTVQTTIIAQDYGKSAKAFNILLRNFNIQRKVGQTWVLYAKYISNGYVQSKTFTYPHADGTTGARSYMEWTQKGRLFLYETLKKHGILPLIEQTSSTNN